MNKLLKYFMIIPIILSLQGCITFHTVSYEITPNGDDGTGTALVTIEDIKTDSATQETLDEDVKSIFEYGLKSQEFSDEMANEGKKITSRNVIVENEKLNAVIHYEFTDINKVEGMQFDDPYYYLTIPPGDSIISTNGQVTKTAEYQRIVWDKSITTLKFKMFSDDTSRKGLKSLAPYYLKEN